MRMVPHYCESAPAIGTTEPETAWYDPIVDVGGTGSDLRTRATRITGSTAPDALRNLTVSGMRFDLAVKIEQPDVAF